VSGEKKTQQRQAHAPRSDQRDAAWPAEPGGHQHNRDVEHTDRDLRLRARIADEYSDGECRGQKWK
jgi:hypothetical protein